MPIIKYAKLLNHRTLYTVNPYIMGHQLDLNSTPLLEFCPIVSVKAIFGKICQMLANLGLLMCDPIMVHPSRRLNPILPYQLLLTPCENHPQKEIMIM